MTRPLSAVLALALCFAGCAPKTTTVTPPAAPNAKLILTLETIRTSCVIAQPFITDPKVATWIGVGCPAAMNTAIATIQAAGTTGKIEGVIAGIQAFLASKPSVISAQDAGYVNAGVTLLDQFLTDYKMLYPNAT